MNLALEIACERLWGPIMEWIHRPSLGKEAILEAYARLSDRQRSALADDVACTFAREHGAASVVAYRYRERPRHVGGLSLTTEEPRYLSRSLYAAYLVHHADVLAHWGQECLPLGGRAFGHEREIILKPDADPRRL